MSKAYSDERPIGSNVTGGSDDIVAQDGVLDAAAHFLQKPFTRDELARKLRESLATE